MAKIAEEERIKREAREAKELAEKRALEYTAKMKQEQEQRAIEAARQAEIQKKKEE